MTTSIPQLDLTQFEGHTEGPWRALILKKYTRVFRDRQGPNDDTGNVQICHIAGPEEDDIRPWNGARWEADARLLAAAPDLLALARSLTEQNAALVAERDRLRKAMNDLPALVVGDACGLDDYTSPPDNPMLLQMRVDELEGCVERAITRATGIDPQPKDPS